MRKATGHSASISRLNSIMETVATRLSEQEIAALAAYFKSVPTDSRK